MICSKIMEMVYQYSNAGHGTEDSISILNQIQISLHTFFCRDCSEKIERLYAARQIMLNDFFPSSPGLEDSIMAKVSKEIEYKESPYFAIPGGLSTRGWIITGLIIFLSLTTAFFGLDFQKIASESGSSFLLPVGITVGIMLTSYGAFFIGSHLKELSERFGL